MPQAPAAAATLAATARSEAEAGMPAWVRLCRAKGHRAELVLEHRCGPDGITSRHRWLCRTCGKDRL